MSTRIVLFVLALVVVAIFMVEKTVKRPADSAPTDNAPQPFASADLDSMRRLAMATPTPAEIAAVAAAFRQYMALENTRRLADLYADNAHIWLHRKQTEDDPDPRQESYSGSALKAYLNGSGPSPVVEEEPEFSTWSDISYRLEFNGHVSVFSTRHSSGYATPHKLIFRPEGGAWLINSEDRTRIGPWRLVRKPEELASPAPY